MKPGSKCQSVNWQQWRGRQRRRAAKVGLSRKIKTKAYWTATYLIQRILPTPPRENGSVYDPPTYLDTSKSIIAKPCSTRTEGRLRGRRTPNVQQSSAAILRSDEAHHRFGNLRQNQSGLSALRRGFSEPIRLGNGSAVGWIERGGSLAAATSINRKPADKP
jgi:hypothetical protein